LSQEEATAGEVSEGKTKEVVVARLAPAGEVTLSHSLPLSGSGDPSPRPELQSRSYPDLQVRRPLGRGQRAPVFVFSSILVLVRVFCCEPLPSLCAGKGTRLN
jgi:hypothetical protein